MLRHRLIANFLGQGWSALIGIIFVPVYIAYIGLEAYELVGLYAVLQGVAALLGGGMVPAVGRTMARFSGGAVSAASLRDLLRSTETLAMGIAVGILVALWLASGWLADHWLRVDTLPRATVADAITILGLTVACRFVEAIYQASLIGLQRQVLANIVTAATSTVRAVGALAVLAWYSPTIEAFFLWQGIVSLVSLAVVARITYAVLPVAGRPGRFSMATIRDVMPFAGGMLTLTALGLLLSQGDKLVLSWLLPLSDYGLYTFASVVANGLMFLTLPVTQSWLPRLVELQSRHEPVKLREAFHACAQVQTVVTGSLGLALVAFSGEAIDLWTSDPQLDRAAGLVSVLALGNVFNAIVQVPHILQISHGHTRLLMRIQSIALLVAFPTLFVAAEYAGALGAAWVWTAINLGFVVLGAPLMLRNILATDIWRWYRDDIAAPLAAAGFVILGFRLLVPMPAGSLGKAAILAMACAATVLSAAIAAPATRQYLRSIVKPLLQRRPG